MRRSDGSSVSRRASSWLLPASRFLGWAHALEARDPEGRRHGRSLGRAEALGELRDRAAEIAVGERILGLLEPLGVGCRGRCRRSRGCRGWRSCTRRSSGVAVLVSTSGTLGGRWWDRYPPLVWNDSSRTLCLHWHGDLWLTRAPVATGTAEASALAIWIRGSARACRSRAASRAAAASAGDRAGHRSCLPPIEHLQPWGEREQAGHRIGRRGGNRRTVRYSSAVRLKPEWTAHRAGAGGPAASS